MKFARLLRATAADMPEMACLLACYKSLKKVVKLLPLAGDTAVAESVLSGCGHESQDPTAAYVSGGQAAADGAPQGVDEMEQRFERALCVHLQQFNTSWMDREEACVIKLQCMLYQVGTAFLRTMLAPNSISHLQRYTRLSL
jgi:hypothetical protein